MAMEHGSVVAIAIAIVVVLVVAVGMGNLARRIAATRDWVAQVARRQSSRPAPQASSNNFAEFYATIPVDNPMPIYPGATIAYPENGSAVGDIVRVAPDEFLIPTPGYYRIIHSESPVSVATLFDSVACVGLLAAQGITGTGQVLGNVMISPGSSYPTSLVIFSGTFCIPFVAADPVATAARNATIALATYLNSIPGGVSVAADLDGTFTPGVYNVPDSAIINTTMVLNGVGLYIFRMAGTFTTAAGAFLNLTGGTQRNSVFFVVAGNVTFGAGTVLPAPQIITAGSFTDLGGSQLQGGILSYGGSVVLSSGGGSTQIQSRQQDGYVPPPPVGVQVAISVAPGPLAAFSPIPKTNFGTFSSGTLSDAPLLHVSVPNTRIQINNPVTSGAPFMLVGNAGGNAPAIARLVIRQESPPALPRPP
jgi:Ice-binding-like